MATIFYYINVLADMNEMASLLRAGIWVRFIAILKLFDGWKGESFFTMQNYISWLGFKCILQSMFFLFLSLWYITESKGCFIDVIYKGYYINILQRKYKERRVQRKYYLKLFPISGTMVFWSGYLHPTHCGDRAKKVVLSQFFSAIHLSSANGQQCNFVHIWLRCLFSD